MIQIKDFFKCINMKKSYKKQILDHNIKNFNLTIRDDIDIFSLIKILIETNKNAVLQIHSVSGTKKIMEDFKQYISKNQYKKLWKS